MPSEGVVLYFDSMLTTSSHRLISPLSAPPVADRFIVGNLPSDMSCRGHSQLTALSPSVLYHDRTRSSILPGVSYVINYTGPPFHSIVTIGLPDPSLTQSVLVSGYLTGAYWKWLNSHNAVKICSMRRS